METVIVSLLTDITGYIRLDLQDPRWQQLLRCKKLLHLAGTEKDFSEFCSRLIKNNRISGNLHLLFELVSARVNQLLHKKQVLAIPKVAEQNRIAQSKTITTTQEEQCCIGLHLVTLFISYFNAYLQPNEVMALLELPNDWIPLSNRQTQSPTQPMGGLHQLYQPQQQQQQQQPYAISSNGLATVNLVQTVLRASIAYPSQQSMYDVAYHSATLLIATINIQIYSPSSIGNSADSDSNVAVASATNPVLNYIYNYANVDLFDIMGHNSEVSSSVSALLIRSWLLLAVDTEADMPDNCIVRQVRKARKKKYAQQQNELDSFIRSAKQRKKKIALTNYNNSHAVSSKSTDIETDVETEEYKSWFIGKFASVLKNWISYRFMTILHVLSPDEYEDENVPLEFLDDHGFQQQQLQQPHQQQHQHQYVTSLYIDNPNYTNVNNRNNNNNHNILNQFQQNEDKASQMKKFSVCVFRNISNDLEYESISPLADKCAALLLLFAHNRRLSSTAATSNTSSSKQRKNAFREILSLLHDEKLESAIEEYQHGQGPCFASDNAVRAGNEFMDNDDVDDMSAGASDYFDGGIGSISSSSSAMHRQMQSKASGMDYHKVYLDFAGIASGLAKGLPKEGSTLLLYTLLQSHHSFLDVLCVCGQLNAIVINLLKGIWTSCAGGNSMSSKSSNSSQATVSPIASIPTVSTNNSNNESYAAVSENTANINIDHLYVLTICLLMIVQDQSVCTQLQHMTIADSSWLNSRTNSAAVAAKKICLLEGILLSMQRAIIFGLIQLRGDRYLLSNCYAILSNISPYVCNISIFTAEKLVVVCCRLCKRIIRINAISQQLQQMQQQTELSVDATLTRVELNNRFGFVKQSESSQSLLSLDSTSHGESLAFAAAANTTVSSAATTPVTSTAMTGSIDIGDTNNASSNTNQIDTNQLESFNEAVAMLLKVIGVCLRPHRRVSNVGLLYSLVQNYEQLQSTVFHPYFATKMNGNPMSPVGHANSSLSSRLISPSASVFVDNPVDGASRPELRLEDIIDINTMNTSSDLEALSMYFADWTNTCITPQVLGLLCAYYYRLLERESESASFVSASMAIESLKATVGAMVNAFPTEVRSNDASLSAAAAVYIYEETPEPEQFFVPHAWRISMQSCFSDISWYLDRVNLFDVLSTKLAVMKEVCLEESDVESTAQVAASSSNVRNRVLNKDGVDSMV